MKTSSIDASGQFKTNTLAAAICAAMAIQSHLAMAQEEPNQTSVDDSVVEEIEVFGIADVYRNAISTKRDSSAIVDVLSSSDIGALPDLSVAETLERITGVTGDRFKGNASEISIRGLGPFLGSSTVNGRQISSGSGNRSVAFTQFPSELVNGVVVYKTQQADILEGGVSGTINIQTIRPIDYGKQQLQAEFKLSYSPYQEKFEDDDGLGTRPSFSYTNAFETAALGEIGFAFGYAGANAPLPEESYNSSSTLRNCNSDFVLDGGSNCSFNGDNAAANGGDPADGEFYFIPNLFYYRQMESEEDRDAFIFATQWRPNDNIDVNFDVQWSKRDYFEDRRDLYFDDGRRRISNWETNSEGALLSYTGESRISSYGEYRNRDEKYQGAGLNLLWQATPNLVVEFDAAHSSTERFQTRIWTRFRSDRAFFDWENRGSDSFPDITAVYTDLDDPAGSALDWTNEIQDLSFFSANSEARNYRFDIEDAINSYRVDLEYAFDNPVLTSIKGGIALSAHDHDNFQEERATLGTPSGDVSDRLNEVAASCGEDFPQSDYGDDANSPVTSWATYNTRCAFGILVGDADLSVAPKDPSSGDVRLVEDIASVYAMLNFGTDLGGMTLSGNAGLRYVTTDVESVGVRTSYSVVTDENGFIRFETNDVLEDSKFTNSYSNVLPSANVSLDINDNFQLKFAGYLGLSRPDMWFYGAGREIDDNNVNSQEATTVPEALENNVLARGNPFLEALESKNLDIALSWFYGEDTMISVGLYYKKFDANIVSRSAIENVIVDGTSYTTEVSGRPTIIDDTSKIQGVELTALHNFGNFGFSINYNYADSDFETQEAGSAITDDVLAIIPPADIAGLSDNTLSSQVYWENDVFTSRLSYKFRSEYLKPFGSNLGQTNRIVDDTSSVDLDLSYKINNQFKLKFQVINLTNEPYVEQRVAHDAFNRIEYSGPRYFVGVQYKM